MDYYEQNLSVQSSFIEMQIDIIEDRIERAIENNDDVRVENLEHRRDRLEQQADIVMEKQLNE